jgi:hypothetical protein
MMPYWNSGVVGGSVFNYQSSEGIGPVYQNPDMTGQGSQESFKGLWWVVLLVLGVLAIWFLFLRG